MGEASRRKRQRSTTGESQADPRLATSIRELREALVALARAIRHDIDDTPARARVGEAAATIADLVDLDGEAAGRLMRGMDRAERTFVATAAALADGLHPVPEGEAAPAIAEDDAEEAVAQLMAFEELPLGSRLGAVINDREIAAFVAAAVTVMGPGWDPFDGDPLDLLDSGAVTAGLAAIRATLLVGEALADVGRLAAMRHAIEVAGLAITGADAEVRDLLSDEAASPAWLLARAFGAGAAAPDGSSRIVRRVGPQLPLAFAAGAGGPRWAAGLETEALFATQVGQLAAALAQVPDDERRAALDMEFVLAAFAAGLAWRHAREDAWLDPWDVAATTAHDAPTEAPGPGADDPGTGAETGARTGGA